MYIITATFDADAAFARTSELLTLGDSPERLAERLGIPRDIEIVKQGVVNASFKRVITDVKQLKHFVEVNKQIDDIKNGKTVLRFLGEGFFFHEGEDGDFDWRDARMEVEDGAHFAIFELLLFVGVA